MEFIFMMFLVAVCAFFLGRTAFRMFSSKRAPGPRLLIGPDTPAFSRVVVAKLGSTRVRKALMFTEAVAASHGIKLNKDNALPIFRQVVRHLVGLERYNRLVKAERRLLDEERRAAKG